MARYFLGGREIFTPDDGQGRIDIGQVRQEAGIPPGRALILQRPSGENIVMPRQGQVMVDPYSHFMEAPVAKRGRDSNIRILEEDVRNLSLAYQVALDDNYQHLFIKNFNTPPGYNFLTIPNLLELPRDYPESPPGVGDSHIYVPSNLRYHGRKPKDFHESSGPSKDWAWWCYESIKWDPCKDDLITFFELFRAHMTNPE
ncbi:E2/UBC family protein [Planctomycetota bacterium]